MAHGINFHYFWNDRLNKTQGALDPNQFEIILERCAKEYHLLDAETFFTKVIQGIAGERDVCITFDDGLRSQYEIAEPLLRKRGLTGFFFIYTSPMSNGYEKIEIFREYRNSYPSIDDFYDDFRKHVIIWGEERGKNYDAVIASEEAKKYHSQYTYYSENDRIFRYIRDEILKSDYDEVMFAMMRLNNYDWKKVSNDLWISKEQIKAMADNGHMIGLHSHSHPTTLNNFSYADKRIEYETNYKYLSSIVGNIKCASYPCDAYDPESEEILKRLGVQMAFLAHYESDIISNLYKISRIDASSYI